MVVLLMPPSVIAVLGVAGCLLCVLVLFGLSSFLVISVSNPTALLVVCPTLVLTLVRSHMAQNRTKIGTRRNPGFFGNRNKLTRRNITGENGNPGPFFPLRMKLLPGA